MKPRGSENGPAPRPLNLTGSTRRLWLVKVPKLVAPHWRSAPAGAVLAHLDLDADLFASAGLETVSRRPIVVTAKTSDDTPDIPKELTLTFTKNKVERMHAFTVHPKGRHAVGVLGQVVREAAIAPVINKEYLDIARRRSEVASLPLKSTKLVSREEIARARGLGFAQTSTDTIFNKKLSREKRIEARAERMDKVDLIALLLSLFREYTYWTLKGLAERTMQPLNHLKDALATVARLNKCGPYAKSYSLKPEYSQPDAAAKNEPMDEVL